MKPVRFDYVRPAGLREAVAALAAEGARPLAGGQSLGPMLNLRLARPALLVDVGRLAELRVLEEAADGVLYGAGVTHAEIEDGAAPDPTGGVLPAVARGIAYRAVRNRGTIGGSLAHADPAADWPTALSALGAVVWIAGPGGKRRVAVEDFITAAFETVLEPQEIVTAVFVPRLSSRARWGYWKACRKVGEFAEAMCAVLSDPERGVHRIAIGATQGRPIVLPQAEGAIAEPEKLDPALIGAGLGDDPAAFSLHRAAIRHAIGAMESGTAQA